MNYTQPGTFTLHTWQETFSGNTLDEQKFVEKMNLKGIPHGMLPLTCSAIRDFNTSLVLIDWTGQPVAHAAYKKDKYTDNPPYNPKVAIIGALCCVGYKGRGLSKYPLHAAVGSAMQDGAEWLEANCNQASSGLFLAMGFQATGKTIDGKTVLSAHHKHIKLPKLMKTFSIELPTFLDGGIYD